MSKPGPNLGRVVVTGGAGFIGSHLVDLLVECGIDHPIVIDDLSTGSRDNLAHLGEQIELVEADIASGDAAEALVGCDVVFHLAVRNVRRSLTHPVSNFDVNANGTLAVLDLLRRRSPKSRFIYVSSSEVYGDAGVEVFRESTLPAPTTVYGAGKLAGEHLARAYATTHGLLATVVRPFNAYGPRSHFEGDAGEVIPRFIVQALAGLPLIIYGDGQQTRDFTYVADTASAIASVAATSPPDHCDTYNIGSGREVAILDLARLVLEVTGSTSLIDHRDPRPGDLRRLKADSSRVEALIGQWATVGLVEGIRRTVAHFERGSLDEMLDLVVDRTWM